MSIVNILTTARGKERAVDGNSYQYYFNRQTEKVKYWICSQRDCSVRLATLVTTNTLVGETWPTHDYTCNILKRKTQELENAVIKKYAEIPGTTTKQVLCDISNKLLASDNSDAIFAMRSGTAIKSRLQHEKKKNADMPKIPKTFEELMKVHIPEKLSKCADGSEFMVHHSWLNDSEMVSLMVFMSDVGADILRRAHIWMVDGTFKIAPTPFYQASFKILCYAKYYYCRTLQIFFLANVLLSKSKVFENFPKIFIF